MIPNRIERINQLLQQELSQLINREIEFPEEIFITLTQVDTSPDLAQSKIFIEVIPDNKKGTALEILRENAKHFKNELYKILSIKKFPQLYFEIDQGEEKVKEIENILDQINSKK